MRFGKDKRSERIEVRPLFLLAPIDEKSRRLDLFRIGGGILISTDAMLEGVALQFVDEAMNYDVPVSSIKLEQRWGRFLRIGRISEFRMVFMRDKSEAFPWEENLLKSRSCGVKPSKFD